MAKVQHSVRRRIYLMRHGSVSYFHPEQKIDGRLVGLNEQGRTDATAAGIAFAHAAIHFDRVITSGLKRTVETAERVLQETRQHVKIECWPELEELCSGELDVIALDDLREAVVGTFSGVVPGEKRFAGGESIDELFARVTPALERLLQDPDWNIVLLVLHGGVNRAILSLALTGKPRFLGNISQAPACINALDVGPKKDDWVVRYVGVAPTDQLQSEARHSTLEVMLDQYIKFRRGASSKEAP
jgi:broad specificity phosphatase PhoE